MTRPVRWSWSLALGVGAAAVSVLATLAPHHVRAGERDLEVVTVRADDGSDPGSDNCFAGVRRGLRRIREVRLQNLTREVAERRLGGSLAGFVEWPRERLAAIVPGSAGSLDALIVIDCRPGANTLDAVALSGTGGLETGALQRLSVHHVPVDEAAARFAGRVLSEWQWRGFSP